MTVLKRKQINRECLERKHLKQDNSGKVKSEREESENGIPKKRTMLNSKHLKRDQSEKEKWEKNKCEKEKYE